MKATVGVRLLGRPRRGGVVAKVASSRFKVREPRPEQPAWKLWLLIGGIVVLLGGAAWMYVGLKPLAPLLELFTGGAQAAEKNQEFMDHLDEHLGNAAVPVGGGIACLLAGFVMIKVGLSPPKPPTVEELVQKEVERRLAAQPTVNASAAPVASPQSPATFATPAPTPVAVRSSAPTQSTTVLQTPASAARRTHCATCSSVLVAGGRICPRGHLQG